MNNSDKSAVSIPSVARKLKEDRIIEASLKQLDTKHLTQLVMVLMREKLAAQTSEQFEENYQKAVEIRQKDPVLFPGNSREEAPLELMWLDRKNSLCSEQEQTVTLSEAKPEPIPMPEKGASRTFFKQGLKLAVTH